MCICCYILFYFISAVFYIKKIIIIFILFILYIFYDFNTYRKNSYTSSSERYWTSFQTLTLTMTGTWWSTTKKTTTITFWTCPRSRRCRLCRVPSHSTPSSRSLITTTGSICIHRSTMRGGILLYIILNYILKSSIFHFICCFCFLILANQQTHHLMINSLYFI